MSRAVLCLLVTLWGAVSPAIARAQDPPGEPPEKKTEERPTGLPARIKWTFNFDAGWGTFGFANSLYDNPKEPWRQREPERPVVRGLRQAGAVGEYTLASSSEVYGKVSAVGERTYGSVPADVRRGRLVVRARGSCPSAGDRASRWRIGENALDFTVGRAQYQLGHGFLLYDGAAEGGSRGGYWTNARKAFEFAAIGRFKPGATPSRRSISTRTSCRRDDTGSRLWGATTSSASARRSTTLGATYMKWSAHHD